MATEAEVERARQFWRNSLDLGIGPKTMAKYAEHERKRTVDAIVAKMPSDFHSSHSSPRDCFACRMVEWIEREFGGAK